LGYKLDADENPVFLYRVNGANVTDAVHALADGGGISREVQVSGPLQNVYFRLAEGKEIKETQDGMYTIDDNAYYLKIESAGNEKPFVRDAEGKKELLVPMTGQLRYSILF
jgi:hypothetical protein